MEGENLLKQMNISIVYEERNVYKFNGGGGGGLQTEAAHAGNGNFCAFFCIFARP